MYRTFKRSATNFNQFSTARRYHDANGLTYQQAQERCKQFNDNRTPAQIRRGTKLEFEKE